MGRILMVVRPSKGGAFGHAVRLGSALAERGHDVAVCGPHGDYRDAIDLDVLELDIARRPSPSQDVRAVVGLGRVLRRFAPDIVHAHGSKGGTVARLARIAKPGVPVVFTPHNYAFTNYFTSRWERGAYRTIEFSLAPLATRVVCVCEAERRIAARLGPASRTRVVYNGINPFERVVPNPAVDALRERGPLICAVSELQPPKGIPTLIDAMPTVLDRVPDANLAIAGDGVLRDRIGAQISGHGLSERVHLLGELPEVSGVYGGSDVFVHPGWAESFPYVILEAMGMGMPIVATDVGGIGEAIEDGVTGRLVEPQDPPALASAIASLLGDREHARALGESARERMMARFSLDSMVEGTVAVYEELGLS
jgi:glycosyltransferase involved in cell wall biosynthesis